MEYIHGENLFNHDSNLLTGVLMLLLQQILLFFLHTV